MRAPQTPPPDLRVIDTQVLQQLTQRIAALPDELQSAADPLDTYRKVLDQLDAAGITYGADFAIDQQIITPLAAAIGNAAQTQSQIIPLRDLFCRITQSPPGWAKDVATDRLRYLQSVLAHLEAQQQQQQGLTAQPSCPEDPTKQELQVFLRHAHALRFNELTGGVEIDGKHMEELDMADSFLAHIHGIEVPKQAARDSFLYIAKANPYNPVAEYLQSLRSRTDLKLLTIHDIAAAFGIAHGDTLSQELLVRHLAGAYRRGIEPGYKHDHIAILVGTQGGKKGTTIEALAPPGLYDGATKVAKALEDREFLTKLNSAWIFEFDEIEKVLLGRDASEFKGFVTRKDDKYVQKWETQSRSNLRRAIAFGTTNCAEVLNDHTGDRRVWILPVTTCNPAWVAANRDSIWATVATWTDWGLSNWLDPASDTAQRAAERARQARISEPWEGVIREKLEALTTPTDGIAQDALIKLALDMTIKEIDRGVQMTVTRIVTADGFSTHNGQYRWIQQKRRYGGGQPRSGYMPALIPAFQQVHAVPAAAGDNGTPQNPWSDRRLTSLFQLFQPL